MSLWKFSSREVRSRPGRAVLTLLSVVLGVAAVVSVTVATATARKAYKQMQRVVSGTAALVVHSEVNEEFDESVVEAVEKTPGVKSALPVVQRISKIFYGDNEDVQLLAIGIDADREDALRDYDLVERRERTAGSESSHNPFDDGDGVLITEDFALGRKLKLNDEIRLMNKRKLKPEEIPIVGILKPRGANVLNQSIVVLPLARMQSLFRARGKVDSIFIVLDDDSQEAAVAARLNEQLPSGIVAERPSSRSQEGDEILRSSEQGLSLASALSLVMAAFIILNTFYMNVGERRRQLATMRALGATRRQVVWMLLREGVVMGLIGTALGIVLGMFGAYYVSSAFGGLFQTDLRVISLTPLALVLAVAFGVGVSFLAAFLPAFRAGKVSPLEGMRSISTEELEGVPRWVSRIGMVVLVISLGLLVACMKLWIPIDYSVAIAVGVMLGFVLLIPLVIEPLTHFAAWLLSPLLHFEGRLASRQILRRRIRATLTTAVLFIAITAGISIANAIINNVNDVRNWNRRTIQGDFFVRAAMPDRATGEAPDIPEEFEKKIREVAKIEEARPDAKAGGGRARIIQYIDTVRFIPRDIAGIRTLIIVRDFAGPKSAPADAKAEIPLDVKSGDKRQLLGQLEAGQIAISTVLAQRANIQVGDQVTLATKDGPRELRVAATVNEYLVGGLAAYMETGAARKVFDIKGVDSYLVKAEPAFRGVVEEKLRKLSDDNKLLFQSTAEVSKLIDNISSGVARALWVILTLCFVVASFGVVNTLTMNVLEQTREIGMLRVVAMTRSQVRKTILAQAAMLGMVGLAPGIVTGVGIAYLMNLVALPVFGHAIDFELHPVLLAECFFGGLAIVLIAAWIPARRAARLDLVTALRRE